MVVVVVDHMEGTDKDEERSHEHVDCENMAWNDDDLGDKNDDDVSSYSYSSFLSFRYTNN
jgi:hypothetical protein